jgi:hypothetical protein
MCLCHALSGMQAPLDLFKRQLETCITLKTGIHLVFPAILKLSEHHHCRAGRSVANLMFGTMQGT